MNVKPDQAYTYERSWNYVIWLLSRKAYSKAQIIDKLKRKQASPDTIEKIMTKLEQYNYIDDGNFAEMYVRSRQKQKGPLALKRELLQKGVSKAIIEESLEPLDEKTQLATAIALLEKQRWRFQKEDDRKNYAKAYAFLARRGFAGDVLKAALERVFQTELDDA